MKNMVRFAIIAVSFFATSFLFGNKLGNDSASEAKSHLIWVSMAAGVAPQLSIYSIGLESPGLSWRLTHLSAYLDYHSVSIKNAALKQSSDYLFSNPNRGLSSGLLIRQFHNESLASFFKIGPELLWPSKDLSSQVRNWGWRASIGGDLFYTRQYWLDDKPSESSFFTQSSFFAQVSIANNSAVADKVQGSPKLFDYVAIELGVRI